MLNISDATGPDAAVGADDLALPAYDRSTIRTGIVHFGLGNFHRAHEAMYLDALMNQGEALDWGICGIGTLPSDARMRDVMAAQDGLYTLVLKHPDGTFTPRVIGSVHDYVFAPDDPEGVLARLADPNTRIVSLTVTEGGYNIDRSTGRFITDAPAIVADAASPHSPSTVFGLIVEGLDRRRAAGIPPFTVMSCDNLPGNGEVARHALVAYAELVDPFLARWIETEVRFPSSMVDRITPTTTDADREFVRERFGVDDGWPVLAEPFTQWVLEDSFTLGRPPFEHAGVQVVPDVMPYELLKLRLLNGGHQALAYAGFLRGHRYAHEGMADPVVAAFVRAHMAEARQTLQEVPGVDVDAYIEQLVVRFGSTAVADTLARLAVDGSDRMAKFVLPAVRDNLEAGRPVPVDAALVAMWRECYLRRSDAGSTIELTDAVAGALQERADAASGPDAFLQVGDVFGALAGNASFLEAYHHAVTVLEASGLEGLVAALELEAPASEPPTVSEPPTPEA
jgi:mannitol 2-dehydrogenase